MKSVAHEVKNNTMNQIWVGVSDIKYPVHEMNAMFVGVTDGVSFSALVREELEDGTSWRHDVSR